MPYSTGSPDRVAIGVREPTREALREEKGDDETWDDVLLRLRDEALEETGPRTAQLREGETRDDSVGHTGKAAERAREQRERAREYLEDGGA